MAHRRKRKIDPLLRHQPWKVFSVFEPIERILHRMEADGTVEVAGRSIVFREDGKGGWYDAVAALRGIIEFHKLAQDRYGIPAEVEAMAKLANKLDAGSPIFISDINNVRQNIESCKRQALQLRISQATDLVNTIQIRMEVEKLAA